MSGGEKVDEDEYATAVGRENTITTIDTRAKRLS
jgi:hypothetical protein